jgi:hypothetical protein
MITSRSPAPTRSKLTTRCSSLGLHLARDLNSAGLRVTLNTYARARRGKLLRSADREKKQAPPTGGGPCDEAW